MATSNTPMLDDVDADLEQIDYDDVPEDVKPGDEVLRANYSGAHDGWIVNNRGTVKRVTDSITTAVVFEEGGQLEAVGADEERVYKVV